MAILAAFAAAASPVVPVNAAPAGSAAPIALTADHVRYNTQTGEVVADGHVLATQADVTITADHLEGDLKTGDVLAAGHVTLKQGPQTATGTALRYNYRTRVGQMQQASTKYGPWTVHGQQFDTAAGQAVALNSSFTPCDPARPAFLVRSRRVVIVPNDHLTAYDSTLYVYGVAVAKVHKYTEVLDPNRRRRGAGPSVGYDPNDGPWIEYSQSYLLGGWDDTLRVRYGTQSDLTGQNIISRRFGDHVWSSDVGRNQAFDQGGNESELDQYSVDLTYNQHRIANWPVSYTLEGHVGRYVEHTPGAVTNNIANRAEGWLNFSGDITYVTPSVYWVWSAQARGDSYDTGQSRTVLGYTVALNKSLNAASNVTLSYNYTSVNGTTPFAFDAVGNDNTVGLTYSYYPGGFLQNGTLGFQYDFIVQQVSASGSIALAVTKKILLSGSAQYNITTQTMSEIDYAVNATCDCLSVGLLYRTFPPNPSQNTFYLTVGLTPFPQSFKTVKF